MPSNKAESKKTMDISKPGKTAPETSSRPVLVTHRPMVQDPMVKEDKKAEDDANEAGNDSKQEPAMHSEKVIKPDNDDVKPEEPATEKPKETDTPEETVEKADSPSQEKPAEKDNSAKEEAAVVDAVADQATADKKKQNELSDEEKARLEEAQKLITSKKYFVPIGQVSHRRNQRSTIILLVLIVIVAGVYLAMDAGLLDVGFDVPYDLIQN